MEDLGAAVLLGIVEGLTEFLPVSSTGHLIVAGRLLGFDNEFGKTFDIAIQLGAIFSVVIYFREKLSSIIKKSFKDALHGNFILSVLLAFLPAAATGFLMHKWIKAHLFNPATVGAALILGGIAILIIEGRKDLGSQEGNVEAISFRQAFLIGCAQCLSLIPGVSRSAATILGGLVFGLNRPAAVEFSFFLAIPTMFTATGYSILKDFGTLNPHQWKTLAIGFMVSMAVALLVIAWFMAFIKKYTFVSFAWYRIIFGALVIFLFF